MSTADTFAALRELFADPDSVYAENLPALWERARTLFRDLDRSILAEQPLIAVLADPAKRDVLLPKETEH